jgi:hypothetical protein
MIAPTTLRAPFALELSRWAATYSFDKANFSLQAAQDGGSWPMS